MPHICEFKNLQIVVVTAVVVSIVVVVIAIGAHGI